MICETCQGDCEQTCHGCDGVGQNFIPPCHYAGRCGDCGGKGRVSCHDCGGSGQVESEDETEDVEQGA